MTGPATQPIPLLTPEEFEARVHDYSRFTHMVFISDHLSIDRADRRITRRMIIRALRKGSLQEGPDWDADRANWVGEMRYLGTGMDLTVVCAIREKVLIVTVVTAYGRPAD